MEALLSQTIPFVHPGIAGIAALCGLIPVVIHFINRRRHRRIRWAAMSFLLAANRRSARRLRFEHWLLMLIRVSVVMLLGLAVARPFIPARSDISGGVLGGSGVHRVLLLDNSLSMNTRGATGSRFESAKACAARLVTSFPPGDPISLVTLAAPSEAVIELPALDRRYVRERLASIQQTQRSTDTIGALTIAREIVESSDAPPGNRVVYLISDFPRREWIGLAESSFIEGSGVPESDRESKGTAADNPTETVRAARLVADKLSNPASDLNLIRVRAPGRRVEAAGAGGGERFVDARNVAITELACERTMTGVNWPMRISARVSNFGASTVDGLTLQWRRDGRIVRDELLPPIGARESTTVTTSMAFARPGTHAVEARLSARGAATPGGTSGVAATEHATSGNLPDDDGRCLSIEVRESTRVLLVDGRPGGRLLDGETGFLATALTPGTRRSRLLRSGSRAVGYGPTSVVDARRAEEGERSARAGLETKVITREELESEALAEFDVISMCNVPRLSGRQWRLLEDFVAGGGGLLIFLGDLVDVDNYNRFGYLEGGGVVPGELALRPRTVELPRVEDAGGAFQADSLIHPMVSEFADHPTTGLFSPTARVSRYLPVEPDARRAEIVLEYFNGDAAWIASDFRRGRVLLCTTTANMAWNNLPAKGDYVSLMLKAVAFLAPHKGDHRNLLVGSMIREPLSAVEATMSLQVSADIMHPSARREGSLIPYGNSLALQYGPVERAGFVELSIGPDRRVVAVNVDPVESDIEGVAEKGELADVLDRPFRWLTDGEIDSDMPTLARATELATVPILLVLVLLLGELWLGMWFRLPRGAPIGDRASFRGRQS